MIRADAEPNTELAERSPNPAQRSPNPAELSLTVELHRAGDDALLRIISLLHRRRCRVTAAEFSAAPGTSARLALRMLAPPAHAGRVEHWLGSLIDVREVVRAD